MQMIIDKSRHFILWALLLTVLLPAPLMAEPARKVIIMGVDGMDPIFVRKFVDAGVMPNTKRLIETGDFKPLQTSMPPLSPTAWSTFITGMDPGGHGIFDFVHRDPDPPNKRIAVMPYLSMSKAHGAEKTFEVGSWVIPLKGGSVELMRKGTPFWELLGEQSVETTIFKMPANFPPSKIHGRAISGMGTPDIRGTPGTFSFYTTLLPADADDFTGGEAYPVEVRNDTVEAKLIGPENSFRRFAKPSKKGGGAGSKDEIEYEFRDLEIPFTVYLDREEAVAKFEVQDSEFVLEEGEWSDWVEVTFEPIPYLVKISAICRFYLQSVRPEFKLYVTPLQINPADPAMPIVEPEDWGHELCEELGFFYTQELPEDTKALSNGVFGPMEFWEQTQFVYAESRKALDHLLDNHEEGLLFFYFSTIDQNCHMLYRYFDVDHPGYEPVEGLRDSVQTLYEEIDEAIGRAMESLDEDSTLIVMSDHGFAPFYWGVNLNTWLLEKGYVTLKDPSKQGRYPLFLNVDWEKTEAYAMGLNGVYVNLRGREREGVVAEGAYDDVLDRLEKDMLEFKDSRNGENVITLVVRTHRDFHGPYLDVGPDIIVGYNRGYRSSWDSPLGEFPKEIFEDNTEAWSGDHAMDYRHVPGVLITNRTITMDEPFLYDLTVAVLDEYGIAPLPEMIGSDCIGPASGEKSSVAAESN